MQRVRDAVHLHAVARELQAFAIRFAFIAQRVVLRRQDKRLRLPRQIGSLQRREIGITAVLFIIWPIVCGIPMMLYYTKIQKFGMLTITGIIGGIFFYLIGYGWIGLLGWVLGGILSDVVLKIGGYQKFKVTVLSYACFCLGIMGCPANLWFAGEAYWENIHTSMGDQYANTLQSLMPSWMLYVGFALLFVGGILGALLGHKMLKKHYESAGIV